MSPIFLVLTYRSELSPKGHEAAEDMSFAIEDWKISTFDMIQFSGFPPSNQLTHVEMANNVPATFQLLGRSTVCERARKNTGELLTREYAKRNERVVGDDGKFTYALARSFNTQL